MCVIGGQYCGQRNRHTSYEGENQYIVGRNHFDDCLVFDQFADYGKVNTPLLGADTVFTKITSFLSSVQPLSILAAVGIFVLLIKWAIDWFLDTEIGLAIRATGDNTKMIRSFFANTDNMKIIGLSVSASGLIRWI